MLVWIASYPGSLDNFLIKTLSRRLGVSWYEADLPDQSNLSLDKMGFGQRSAKGPWRKAYEKALESDQLILARTSTPPRDEQPFIYLSRNGPDQIREFYGRFLASDPAFSLTSLILGHALVGDWTSNYTAWRQRDRTDNGAFLRIEDFFADQSEFFEDVSRVIGRDLAATPQLLGAEDPRTHYTPPSGTDWSPSDARLFEAIHGASACERGYSHEPGPSPVDENSSVPLDAVLKLISQHRTSVGLVGEMHSMSGYIDSLKVQLAEETERLRDYVAILKEENARLKSTPP